MLEKKLRALLNDNDVQYVEPYSGTAGHKCAEIFMPHHHIRNFENGTQSKCLNLLIEAGLKPDHDYTTRRVKRGELQYFIENQNALEKFKAKVEEKYQQLQSQIKTEPKESSTYYSAPQSNSFTLYKSSNISKMKICESFNLNPNDILSVVDGLVQSIEIKTTSIKAAEHIAQQIRSKLETGNKKYGGLIRDGGTFGKDPIVEVSVGALEALKDFLNQSTSNYKPLLSWIRDL